jgi:hypothetical protein
VQVGVGEVHGAIMRMVGAETWEAVSKQNPVASCAVEMTRMIDVSAVGAAHEDGGACVGHRAAGYIDCCLSIAPGVLRSFKDMG